MITQTDIAQMTDAEIDELITALQEELYNNRNWKKNEDIRELTEQDAQELNALLACE